MDGLISIHHQRKQRDVSRMNGNPMLRRYDLSQHGFFVLSHAIDLARIFGVSLSMDETDVILRHDFAETVTTDLPYPVKNMNESTKKAWDTIEKEALSSKGEAYLKYADEGIQSILHEEVKWWIFKFSDMLELAITCWEEVSMGNRSLQVNRVICKSADVLIKMINQVDLEKRELIKKYIASSKFPHVLDPKLSCHEEL